MKSPGIVCANLLAADPRGGRVPSSTRLLGTNLRRSVSLKGLEAGAAKPAGGGTCRIECTFIKGIPDGVSAR